jgi:hypothetical protein
MLNRTLNGLYKRELELLLEIEDIKKSKIFSKLPDIKDKLLEQIDVELQAIRCERAIMNFKWR